jgi:SAM-dependent methyltransferase
MDRYDDLSPEAIAAHDRQRVMPPDAKRDLIGQLRSYIGSGPCLDAGSGTGAIAIPLVDSGTPIIALDISRAMLRECQRKRGSKTTPVLVRGDMARLPFQDETFAGVHCAHTLHLIDDWKRATGEAIRVTRLGGHVLVTLGGDPTAPPQITEIQDTFWKALGSLVALPESPSLSSEESFHDAMLEFGAEPQPAIVVLYQDSITPEQEIDRLEQNVFARPDGVDERLVQQAARTARIWSADCFGSLEHRIHRQRTLTYHVYRKSR